MLFMEYYCHRYKVNVPTLVHIVLRSKFDFGRPKVLASLFPLGLLLLDAVVS